MHTLRRSQALAALVAVLMLSGCTQVSDLGARVGALTDGLTADDDAAPPPLATATAAADQPVLCSLCILLPDGQALRPDPTGLAGRIERVERTGELVRLEGWAADLTTGQPGAQVMVFAGNRLVAQGQPSLPRPAIARSFGATGLEFSGFSVSVALAELQQGEAELRVFVTSDDRAVQIVQQ